jgi:clan AA aspartic protease
MIGAVSGDGGEPLLPLTLVGYSDGRVPEEEVRAVVDTGFDGELTLPEGLIRWLGYAYVGTIDAELADGSEVETEVFSGLVVWHGERREAGVLAAEGSPLIGMGLLAGSRLVVEAEPGGGVAVEEVGRAR